jgi:hypothetical protein
MRLGGNVLDLHTRHGSIWRRKYTHFAGKLDAVNRMLHAVLLWTSNADSRRLTPCGNLPSA